MSSFLSRQSTFDRGFALLASPLCSFQCTSGDEKRKSGIGAVTTVTVEGFEKYLLHEIHDATSFK